MQRYFVDINKGEFVLSKEQLHQIKDVMRCSVNDEMIFINDGFFYTVKITKLNPFNIEVISKEQASSELKKEITLLYCLSKKDKIDFAIQKATELGANKIVLVNSSRSVLKIKKEDEEKKFSRYDKIAREASEQCGRGIIPKIEGVIDFSNIKECLSDINFIAYEKERSLTLNEDLLKDKNSISILIGPEGGFSQQEEEYANKNGFLSLSLGKRILRSETAVVYALSLLSHYVEK